MTTIKFKNGSKIVLTPKRKMKNNLKGEFLTEREELEIAAQIKYDPTSK